MHRALLHKSLVSENFILFAIGLGNFERIIVTTSNIKYFDILNDN